MRIKYSPRGEEHPIEVIGIHPGEKLHEVLVNEYEMKRVTEEANFFAVHAEYDREVSFTPKLIGEEYTSANTQQLTEYSEIEAALDAMGELAFYA